MSDDNQGDDQNSRENMAKVIMLEWNSFEQKMKSLINQLSLSDESRESMRISIDNLFSITKTLNGMDYTLKEDRGTFLELIQSLEVSISEFLMSYIKNNNIGNRIKNNNVLLSVKNSDGYRVKRSYKNDTIVCLKDIVMDSIAERKNMDPYDYQYCYPAIYQLVKFLRNRQYHEKLNFPRDYRTQTRSFGNLYTLSCQLTLTFYSFIEILSEWVSVTPKKQI